MPVGKVGVSRRGRMPPMPKQLADERQVLAGHDRMAGCGVAEVMQPQLAKLRIAANRPPAFRKTVCSPALGVSRKQKRIGAPLAGQRVDMRPGGLPERPDRAHRAEALDLDHVWGNGAAPGLPAYAGGEPRRERETAEGHQAPALRLDAGRADALVPHLGRLLVGVTGSGVAP